MVDPMAKLRIILVALLALAAFPAWAMETREFDKAAFDAARAAGRPVVVEIWASWCPVCQQQGVVIERLKKDPELAGLVLFELDFDKDKAALRDFRVTRQSTLIAYKAGAEVARSTGVTDPAEIRAMFDKAR